MTRDVAAQAVHERLEHLAASMPLPDMDAGWSALSSQLEPPVAQVIPLRRPRHRRTVVLGVAAAMLVASGAFAMVRHGGDEAAGAPGERSGTTAPSYLRVGPRVHPPFVGPPSSRPTAPSITAGGHHNHVGGGTASPGDHPSSIEPSGGTSSGSSHHQGPHTFHHDSPDDTDHGTGNDGSHDDNGQGNDAQGQDPQDQGPQGNEGSSGGAGRDQGSASGQASSRGADGGSQGSGARAGHGQGDGPGPNA